MSCTETRTPYEVAQEIARQLDPSWTAQEGGTRWEKENGATLRGPDDLMVRLSWNGSRITASGVFPEALTRAAKELVSIGFAADKPASVMARDIKRRLLPRYQAGMTEARVQTEAWAQLRAERDRYLDAAAETLAPLGFVHRSTAGPKLYVGDPEEPVEVSVEVESRRTYPGAREPKARVTVSLHRDLLARLTPAVTALGTPPAPGGLRAALETQAREWERISAERYRAEVDSTSDVEDDTMSECYGEAAAFLRRMLAEHAAAPELDPAALSPRTIYLAWRDVDDMIGFETAERRDEYADAVPGVETGTLDLLNDSAARQFIIDSAAEAPDSCECAGDPVPGVFLVQDGWNAIQACNLCSRYKYDRDAALAVAAAVGGAAFERPAAPAAGRAAYWVVERNGEELTPERIAELAVDRSAEAEPMPGPCPACGDRDNQSYQNADDDRARCGVCCTEYFDNEDQGDTSASAVPLAGGE